MLEWTWMLGRIKIWGLASSRCVLWYECEMPYMHIQLNTWSQMASLFWKVVEFWGGRASLGEVGRGKPWGRITQLYFLFSLFPDCRWNVNISFFSHHGFPILVWTPGTISQYKPFFLKLLLIVYLVIAIRKVTNNLCF